LEIYGKNTTSTLIVREPRFKPWITTGTDISNSYPQFPNFVIDLGPTAFNTLGVSLNVKGYVMWTDSNAGTGNCTSFIFTYLSSSDPFSSLTGTDFTGFPYQLPFSADSTGAVTTQYTRGPPSRATLAGSAGTATIDTTIYQADVMSNTTTRTNLRYLTIGLYSQFDNGSLITTLTNRRTTIGWPTAAATPYSTSGFFLSGGNTGFDFGEGTGGNSPMNPAQFELVWSKTS
jgi:hypothetical protein